MSDEEKAAIKKEEKRLKEEAEKELLKEEEDYKKQTDVERKKYFKGTIVVIVIYGIIILGMSIGGIASPTIRDILFVAGFPFTVTFISGVILIIILLLAQLFNYKPAPMPEKYSGENMSCPDYWILKKTDKAELAKMDKKIRHLSKYYCENPEIVNTPTGNNDIDLPGTITGAPESAKRELRQLKDVSAKYDNTTTIAANYHMKCNRLYPDYMAAVDKRNFPLNPTAMRCEYVKQCNIAWTGACPK